MNSFPSSFINKFIPYQNDEILRKIRTDIVHIVEHQRQLHKEGAYFYISYSNRILSANSPNNLVQLDKKDREKCSDVCYDSHGNPTIMMRNHQYILDIIGNELNKLFGDNFQTVHDIGYDEEKYVCHPISNNFRCSGKCYIQFVS